MFLDLDCGDCFFVLEIRRKVRVYTYIGVDIRSLDYVEMYKKQEVLYIRLGLNNNALPLRENSVDCVA